MGADSFLGYPISAGCLPFQLDRQRDGRRRPLGGKDAGQRDRTRANGEGDEPNLEGLKKKYPWWLAGHKKEESATSPKKADLDDTVTLFESSKEEDDITKGSVPDKDDRDC
jgi:hypothetical protein